MNSRIIAFLTESNAIEGIMRPPTDGEVKATVNFLRLSEVKVSNLVHLVEVYAPGHQLRSLVGLDVRVGSYIPPKGGPHILTQLELVIARAHLYSSPWSVHLDYESLHPFTDGNGRSGRALWAWQMVRQDNDPFALPFLHRFYYQTLKENPR